jgi:hypothetical protein
MTVNTPGEVDILTELTEIWVGESVEIGVKLDSELDTATYHHN